MSAPEGYRLVDVSRDRADDRLHLNSWGFAMDVPVEHQAGYTETFPWARGRGVAVADASRGAVDSLAGVHASYPLTMRVPGGTVPTSGLTWVSVHPAHRRRGVLRAMIADHFARSLARGEAVSALYAAEAPIYQRFGYGCASWAARVDLGRAPELREIPGASDLTVGLDNADAAVHLPIIQAVQARLTRPGSIVDITPPLTVETFLDIPQWREGKEPLRCAWVEDEDGAAAYALFARHGKWDGAMPDGTVEVHEWGAATPAALQRLIAVLSDLDLMSRCYLNCVPLDSPLLHMLRNPRTLQPSVSDNLWVRVLDLPAALERRNYAHDVDAVIEVTDEQLPANAGPWHLRIDGGRATVTAAPGARADLGIGIQELSAAYLGGITLTAQANAGLLTEHTPGTVERLTRTFTASELAVCSTPF